MPLLLTHPILIYPGPLYEQSLWLLLSNFPSPILALFLWLPHCRSLYEIFLTESIVPLFAIQRMSGFQVLADIVVLQFENNMWLSTVLNTCIWCSILNLGCSLCNPCFYLSFFWRKFLLESFVTNAVLKATSVTVEMLVIFIVIIFLLWRINWCSLCLCWVHNKVFYGLRMVYFLMLILFILHCWIYMCVEFTIFLVKEEKKG